MGNNFSIRAIMGKSIKGAIHVFFGKFEEKILMNFFLSLNKYYLVYLCKRKIYSNFYKISSLF